jgi:hypothetical protein
MVVEAHRVERTDDLSGTINLMSVISDEVSSR